MELFGQETQADCQRQLLEVLKYGKSFPTDADIANAVPCRPLIDEIDLELLTDSVDAIQDNELVYVDELPDGSPYFVASHGLPTFEIGQCNTSKRPLVQRGAIDYVLRCRESHDCSVDFAFVTLTRQLSRFVSKERPSNACLQGYNP